MELYIIVLIFLISSIGLIFAYYECFCCRAPSIEMTKAQGNKKNVVVIDVRNQSEWDNGHVDETLAPVLHIPLGSLATSSKLPSKDTPILIHCAVGGRSAKGKRLLEGMGYTSVVNSMTIGGTEAALTKGQ
tara:strand:+ start:170 stop:562 length:393 start_codon:yes stop_codon:yes gene_type:complete